MTALRSIEQSPPFSAAYVARRAAAQRTASAPQREAAKAAQRPVDREAADRRLCPPSLRGALERARREEAAARPARARELYERVLASLSGAEHAYLAACVMRWIARTFVTEGDLLAARDQLELSLTVAARCNSHLGMASALNFLGAVSQLTGEVEQAKGYYARALDRATDAGDRQLLAMVQQNLGAIAAEVEGRHDEALAHFQQALQGYRALGLDARAAAAWSNIGKAYTALGRFSRARRAHNRALAICERVGDRAQALRACANLAELHVTRGRYVQAERLCAEVLAAPGAGASQWEAEAHLYAGIAARELQNLDEASVHFASAERIALQRGDPLLSAETAREQATLLARQGRNADAFAQLRIAYAHFERLRARRGLVDIEERFARFEQQFLFVVEGWGRSLEMCDPYTRGHCDRVADLATRLAESVGFDQRTLFWFRVGALLHDIGKMRLPAGVLTKPGPLTAAERAAMQRHPEEGVALLGSIEFPWDVRPMIRGHHERWDGSGYPDRLAGEQIPLAARILTIADVYDALTTTRSYRAAHDHFAALDIMRSERGTTFDPMLFDSFVSILGRMQEAA